MEFKVSELEREPIDFDLELAPGWSIWARRHAGRGFGHVRHAEVLHEHRGPRDIVADIRLRGTLPANSRFRARAAWSRSKFHSAPTST